MWKLEDLRGHEAYLDSNIIIYAFEAADATTLHGLGALFADIGSGATRARTSLITRAEVLVRPLRDKQDDLVRAYRELLSGTQDIAVQPVDAGIVDRAAALRAAHRALRLPDALHLATALLCECRYFLTSDKRLTATIPGVEILPLHQMRRG